MRKRQAIRVSRAMSLEELPAFLKTDELCEYLQIGATKGYALMQRFGVKVGAGHRLPKDRIPEIFEERA